MILRLLNPQGLAGLAAALILALLLAAAKIETRHWRKQSDRFEQLYRGEVRAHSETVAAYRSAAESARASDRANAARVRGDQRRINERTADDYESRLAAARARAQRLRPQAPSATAGGGCRATPVPGLSPPAAGVAEAAGQDRLPDPDRLLATEQAIQLDELIRWIRAQSAVDPNRPERD